MDVVAGGLSRIGLFAGLDADAVGEIESACVWHAFDSGEQVFDKESDTLEVYFVVDGAVRILTAVGEDQEVALADVVAGNYFGELAAIDGMKRSARVVATRPSRLASLPGSDFLALMRRQPEVALRVLERLARIVRNLDSRVTQLSTQNTAQRIYNELIRLAEPDPARPEGWMIPDLPNHKEIAAWSGTDRETVAQAIGELARDGIVRRKGMGLVIADWARLRLMAQAHAA